MRISQKLNVQLVALSSLALLAASPAFGHGAEGHDVVVNEKGSMVVSKSGCVISKWQTGHEGDCGVKPEPAPEPIKKPIVQKPTPQPATDARTVYFDFDKADLTGQAVGKLDSLVTWLSGAKGVTGATVYGFADQLGNSDYNQKLSARRAAAVENYLASRGIVLPTNVEIVKAFGETGSLTQCDTSLSRSEKIKCLAADRRVEVKFDIVR